MDWMYYDSLTVPHYIYIQRNLHHSGPDVELKLTVLMVWHPASSTKQGEEEK